ncbi:MAG TPA: hypothetical protein VMY78_05950 [Solirubrobacteraceae bacterium]|nr:hypothetical protein [Solirubrobacteraceae bacterium]
MRLAVVACGAVAALALGGCSDSGDSQPSGAGGPATTAGEALARRAQALVDVAPSDLGYRLVVAGPRGDGVRGATDTKLRTITLYVLPGDGAHRVAHDLAHEIGHAYDDRRLTEDEREDWLRVRGAPRARWFPGGPASDYDTGAGDFAEVFARCHAASPEFRSRLGPRPADACSLLPAGARADRLKRPA